jgi:hypothetical protein
MRWRHAGEKGECKIAPNERRVIADLPITPELAEAITADPKAYYVNLHTAEFPAGVIRGQLK